MGMSDARTRICCNYMLTGVTMSPDKIVESSVKQRIKQRYVPARKVDVQRWGSTCCPLRYAGGS